MGISFSWLNPPFSSRLPVTFGAPWGRNELDRKEALCLIDQNGKPIPAQFKPIAFWPDGSVKWTSVSAVLSKNDRFTVQKDTAENSTVLPDPPVLHAFCRDGKIVIDSDLLYCEVEEGATPIAMLQHKGMKAAQGRIAVYLQREEEAEGIETTRVYKLTGKAEKITLEEAGPLRAVVKLEGTHYPAASGTGLAETYFPFSLRLYFYAGSSQIRLVHSFGLDMDQNRDHLKGVAIELDIPNSGELYNRHIGFVGEEGMFYEACRNLYKGGGIWKKSDANTVNTSEEECLAFYNRQLLDGQLVYPDPVKNEDFIQVVSDNAAWDRFLLRQVNCDSYHIEKRTQKGCTMLRAAAGGRSNGGVFYGDEGYMVTAAIRDFWRKAPRALEAEGLRSDRTRLTLWLYSKYEDAYDFSAYDTLVHTRSYEGGNNFTDGISNTSEIIVKLYDQMPGKEEIISVAKDAQQDVLPTAEPKTYQETAVFGRFWWDIGKYTDGIDIIRALAEYAHDEIDRRKWYGFWDYGDVMLTYEDTRHCWRYDVGGYAWENTELCNTYMSWYAYLLTGDPKLYQLAAAMSRHCSETDIYHFGELAPLGSRHHVRHWGDGAKEPRISMAGHYRFYYYLTADERMGDIMDLVKDVDKAAARYDIMGLSYFGRHDDPRYSHQRSGPDWTAFVSSWMTAWERHEDLESRDKILAGLNSIAKAPLRLGSGSTFHYDQETGEMLYMDQDGPVGHRHPGDSNYQYEMIADFGGPEILFELEEWLDDPLLSDMILEFSNYGIMQPEERKKATGGRYNDENMGGWNEAEKGGFFARMFAYAAAKGNAGALQTAADFLKKRRCNDDIFQKRLDLTSILDENNKIVVKYVSGKDVLYPVTEVENYTMNGSGQSAMIYLECAHFLKDIPTDQ